MDAKARFDNGEITAEEYIAELEAEKTTLESKLHKQQTAQFRLKVSEKGALSIYGLGKFPVTLYKEQWLRLLGFAKEIVQFIKDHDSELRNKADGPAPVKTPSQDMADAFKAAGNA